MKLSIEARADFALALVALLWGGTFVLVKAALDDISSLVYLALRFALAGTLLLWYFRRAPVFRMPAKAYLITALVGGLLMTGYILQTIGLKTITPAKSAFLTGLYIPLVPVFGAIIWRKLPMWQEIVGLVLAVGGTAMLSWPEESARIAIGDWLTIACALAYACHILALGHFTPQVGLARMTCWQIMFGSLFAAIGSPIIEKPFWHVTTPTIAAIVVGGVFATAIAFGLQTWGQQHTSATRAALIFSLEPVFAWVVSFLVIGEVLTMRAGFGAALVLTGILFAELKPQFGKPA